MLTLQVSKKKPEYVCTCTYNSISVVIGDALWCSHAMLWCYVCCMYDTATEYVTLGKSLSNTGARGSKVDVDQSSNQVKANMFLHVTIMLE